MIIFHKPSKEKILRRFTIFSIDLWKNKELGQEADMLECRNI